MPKHHIDQSVESSYPDRFRWTVKISIDSTNGDDHTIVEANGAAETDDEAVELAGEFTRWAVLKYNLFGLEKA